LIKAVFANVPWPTPVGIGAFIGTGDWKSVILALICAVAAFLVYYPFIRNYDRKLVKEEREASAIA
jgi:PTS system cellobiose-specific IIC component